ncbi:MAG: pyruvate, water dikinase regulatory protein [Hyphomicrobiales bacterium]
MGAPVRPACHMHLISDSTGETLNVVARAAAAYYQHFRLIERTYALVRGPEQLRSVLRKVESNPGIVLFTLVDGELRDRLEARCLEVGVPCISVLDPVVAALAAYLNTSPKPAAGAQHTLNTEYFNRIEALDYAMLHDDGRHSETLDIADVILIGVSRTSKTPTSMYLANRGLKVANIPVIAGLPLPQIPDETNAPLVVGLVAAPLRIAQIRRNRLISLNQGDETPYLDHRTIRKELLATKSLCLEKDWPVIDVTRRSIEETAAAILNLLSARRNEKRVGP